MTFFRRKMPKKLLCGGTFLLRASLNLFSHKPSLCLAWEGVAVGEPLSPESCLQKPLLLSPALERNIVFQTFSSFRNPQ